VTLKLAETSFVKSRPSVPYDDDILFTYSQRNTFGDICSTFLQAERSFVSSVQTLKVWMWWVGTILIRDFMAVTFSVKLVIFSNKTPVAVKFSEIFFLWNLAGRCHLCRFLDFYCYISIQTLSFAECCTAMHGILVIGVYYLLPAFTADSFDKHWQICCVWSTKHYISRQLCNPL